MAFDGLSAFRAKQESHASSKQEQKFYKPTGKGQKVLVRPLVELDNASLGFNPKNGTATFSQEFQNPQKYWLSIVDTRDAEGACVGWDMVTKYGWYKANDPDREKGQHSDPKFNWNPKRWVYIPALVKENPEDEPRVEILQLAYNGDVAQAFISFAEDSEVDGQFRSITDRWWTYARNNGEGFAVRYTITPKDPSTDVDVSDYDVPDLGDILNNVPYAEQAAFLQIASNEERNAAPVEAAVAPAQVQSAVATANW